MLIVKCRGDYFKSTLRVVIENEWSLHVSFLAHNNLLIIHLRSQWGKHEYKAWGHEVEVKPKLSLSLGAETEAKALKSK